jgi:cell division protein FtsB
MKKLEGRTVLIVVLVLVLGFLFGNSGFRNLVRRHLELRKLRSIKDQLRKENVLLKKEIYLLENDETYIERIARKELGLISNGEVEYRFNKK